MPNSPFEGVDITAGPFVDPGTAAGYGLAHGLAARDQVPRSNFIDWVCFASYLQGYGLGLIARQKKLVVLKAYQHEHRN